MLLTFHGHLTGLLHQAWQKQPRIEYDLTRRASIKDIIEAVGAPHTEIGRLLVNGREVSFQFIPDDSDAAEIYPLTGPDDFLCASTLRPAPLANLIFIVDISAGKLARLLRMRGLTRRMTIRLPRRKC